MGPNPREGEITGELRVGLITEKGEPKMLLGLLEAELFGCCVDMAHKLPTEDNDVSCEGYQSEGDNNSTVSWLINRLLVTMWQKLN